MSYIFMNDPRDLQSHLLGRVINKKTQEAINIKLDVDSKSNPLDVCVNFYKTVRGVLDLVDHVQIMERADQVESSVKKLIDANFSYMSHVVDDEDDYDEEEYEDEEYEDEDNYEEEDYEEDEEKESLDNDTSSSREESVKPVETSASFGSLSSWFENTDTSRYLDKNKNK